MNKISKVVIPIAGYGSRMFPSTLGVVKAMLPLVDKPVILYLIEEALAANMNEIIIVYSSTQESVKNYLLLQDEAVLEHFKDKKEVIELKTLLSKIKLTFVLQKEQKGLGDAIASAKDAVSGEDFAVILGDNPILARDVKSYGVGQLYDEYQKENGYYIGVKEVDIKDASKYGIVSSKNISGSTFLLDGMIEKPKDNPPSKYAALGRYILKNSIFDYLKDTTEGVGGEIQITDALIKAIEHEKVYGTVLSGTCHDTGNRAGFVKANIDYALDRDDVYPDIKKYLKDDVKDYFK